MLFLSLILPVVCASVWAQETYLPSLQPELFLEVLKFPNNHQRLGFMQETPQKRGLSAGPPAGEAGPLLEKIPLAGLLDRYQKTSAIFHCSAGEELHLSASFTMNSSKENCDENSCLTDRAFILLTYANGQEPAATVKAMDVYNPPLIGIFRKRAAILRAFQKEYKLSLDIHFTDWLSSRIFLKSTGGHPNPQPGSFSLKELAEAMYQTGCPVNNMERPYRLIYVTNTLQKKGPQGLTKMEYVHSRSLIFMYKGGFYTLPAEEILYPSEVKYRRLDKTNPSAPYYGFRINQQNELEIYAPSQSSGTMEAPGGRDAPSNSVKSHL